MFAVVFPLLIAVAVLTGAPEPETTATPIAQTAPEVETTAAQPATSATPVAQAAPEVEASPTEPVPSAMPVVAQAKRPMPRDKPDICSAITEADLKQLPHYAGSTMDGYKNFLLQPCTLAPNQISVSFSYDNMTTLQGSRGRDRVFFPNALIEIGSVNPNLTFDLLTPTYSPGHTRDILLSDGDHTTFSSEGGNSDLAIGGTYRFDNGTSRFAIGFTGLAIVPTSERGFGTEALGGITSIDVGLQLGPFDINTSIAGRFTTGGISPLSPFTLFSGKGASDCDSGFKFTIPGGSSGSTGSTSDRHDLFSGDRDKEYFTFNPSLTVGTWVPLSPTEPTFVYVGGSYFSQTSADTESSRAAYHIGIVQPLSPRLNIGLDWGYSPPTDTSRESQRALSTDISYKF